MVRAVVGRMPLWAAENQDVETAMLTDRDGAEYRQTDGAEDKSQGMRASGHENPDGHDPMGMKNNPDRKK